MKTNNNAQKTNHPEKDGKVPASGVMSETYKEEVSPQDLLVSSKDPQDPEEPDHSKEKDFNSYPLEEVDTSVEKDTEIDRDVDKNNDNGERDINSPANNDDEFLK